MGVLRRTRATLPPSWSVRRTVSRDWWCSCAHRRAENLEPRDDRSKPLRRVPVITRLLPEPRFRPLSVPVPRKRLAQSNTLLRLPGRWARFSAFRTANGLRPQRNRLSARTRASIQGVAIIVIGRSIEEYNQNKVIRETKLVENDSKIGSHKISRTSLTPLGS